VIQTLLYLAGLCVALGLVAQPFQLPTANRAILEPDGGPKADTKLKNEFDPFQGQ